MPKKILISFDGAGDNEIKSAPNKETDRHFKNPLKLHILAGGSLCNTRNDVPGQYCIYERGIGGKSPFAIVRLAQFALGILSQQTASARKKLAKIYEEGDDVYVIGYSRGAASARKFACELNKGLPCFGGKPVPIKFLGCFDTVEMQAHKRLVGIIRDRRRRQFTKSHVLGETHGKLPPNVKRAVHHVSIDDNRFAIVVPFCPVLMDSKDPRVHEIWFPGEHGDVGGNYYTKGVPDTSCRAMQEWLERDGLKFLQTKDIRPESLVVQQIYCCQKSSSMIEIIDPSEITIAPNPADKLHLYEFPQKVNSPSYRPVVCVTNEHILKDATVKVHVSALQHMEAMNKQITPYKINPEIKKAKIVLVGSLGNELKEETKRFKTLLGFDGEC